MILSYNVENFTQDIICSHNISIESKNQDFHLHNGYEIYLFLRGDVNYFVEQSVYKLKRANLLIFNSQEIHRPTFLSQQPYERVIIHFLPQVIEKLSTENTNLLECFTNRSLGKNNIILLSENDLNCFLELSYKIIGIIKNNQYAADILSRSYLCELLVMLNRKFQDIVQTEQYNISYKVQEILSYINLNLDSKLSLDILEKTFSTNRYYLCRLFKQETGSTIYNYIILKKIALAKQLLSENNNVTEVCMMTGFNDYSNFIRTFKKVTGYSPANYNKLHNSCDIIIHNQ